MGIQSSNCSSQKLRRWRNWQFQQAIHAGRRACPISEVMVHCQVLFLVMYYLLHISLSPERSTAGHGIETTTPANLWNASPSFSANKHHHPLPRLVFVSFCLATLCRCVFSFSSYYRLINILLSLSFSTAVRGNPFSLTLPPNRQHSTLLRERYGPVNIPTDELTDS